jgi:RNA-directed DNA polymerase
VVSFDNISHQWLLDNIPMDKGVLGKWLKSGFIEGRDLFPTEAGAPQGGIISPALANMALDGMEKELAKRFGALHGRGTSLARKNKVRLVRYADDFIITCSTKEGLGEVEEAVKGFLAERGLSLSPEKTRIANIKDGFDFLGWNIRKYDGKLLITPARDNVQRFLRKCREIIKGAGAMKQETLIAKLNPVIRGWANYHASQVSKETFHRVDHEIWQALWKWASRRHPAKGSQWIKGRYFQRSGNRNWVFGTRKAGGDGEDVDRRLVLASDTPIKRHTKIKADANPFDPEWEVYFEERETKAMKATLWGRVKRLWSEQEGKCPICRQAIQSRDVMHVHHIVWKEQGGGDEITNLALLHANCHRLVHAMYESGELSAL